VDCTSRICRDPGTGVSICQPATGGRLTEDWCLNDSDCCGGGINPNGSVHCTNTLGATQLGGRCDQGSAGSGTKACLPTGNICGAPQPDGKINAPQNCCDGQKTVCKEDSSGIPRCFGGAGEVDPIACPDGYNGNKPLCCIATGESCQFRDQCCGLAPCLPAAGGGYKCGTTCTLLGTTCTSDSECCDGATCYHPEGAGAFCANVSAPPPDGGTADGGTPDGGTGADAGVPGANGDPCTVAGDCASNICTSNVCTAPPTATCGGVEAPCTATADCCVGTYCQVPSGQSVGSCATGPSCPSLGQPCSTASACCSGLTCSSTSSSCVWLPPQ